VSGATGAAAPLDRAAASADPLAEHHNPVAAHADPVSAHADPLAAQRLAEDVSRGLQASDAAARALGIEIVSVAPGQACAAMTVRPDMLNGFGICHGGLIATLADTAFAYACNSYNELTVAAGITVDFVAPAHAGERLLAQAREMARSGRTGVYDVAVTDPHGRVVALLRGRSHTRKGKPAVPQADG